MSDRKYYVFCEDNCKFESMTKEEIIAAIAEATGNTPTNIDDAFITKLKELNRGAGIKFWIGTQAEYNAIENPEANVLYIFTDSSEWDDIERLARETAQAVVDDKMDKNATSDLNMNGMSITNVAFPTSDNDAATKSYVEGNFLKIYPIVYDDATGVQTGGDVNIEYMNALEDNSVILVNERIILTRNKAEANQIEFTGMIYSDQNAETNSIMIQTLKLILANNDNGWYIDMANSGVNTMLIKPDSTSIFMQVMTIKRIETLHKITMGVG